MNRDQLDDLESFVQKDKFEAYDDFKFMDDEFYCAMCGEALDEVEQRLFNKDNVQACMACREKENL